VTYREHPSKVVRLSAGQLVGYPPASEDDCTFWVALQDAPDEWEGVLGKREQSNTAELVGIPVVAYGRHLGDLVSVLSLAKGAEVVSGVSPIAATSPSECSSSASRTPASAGGA
jgi:hypothetical protein